RRVVFSSSALDRAQRVPHRTTQLRDAMKSAVKAASSSLFSLLFPSDCRICRSPLTTIASLPVCEPCLAQIVPLEGLLCRVCGEKLFSSVVGGEEGALCGVCRRAEPHFRRAAAYGAYEGRLRDLIHLFKYKGTRPAGKLLGSLLNQAVTAMALPDSLIVVPVPLWSGKRNSRGFNQAEAIARTFTHFQTSSSIQLDTTVLVRTRETASQTGLTRHQRRANVRGAFAVRKPEKVKGRSVLIVDDVMTTGTTAGECARVLRRAGAKEVFVATVARATKEAGSVLVMAAGAPSGGSQGHA
ncbi:MAG TPA: ComF family protein, partial [Candidatus Dormibacteraeota bacterium]|nr:ComF family protein [Candidatus Dormibacteraeota bacterium]